MSGEQLKDSLVTKEGPKSAEKTTEGKEQGKEKVQKSLLEVQKDIDNFVKKVSKEVLGNSNLAHSSRLEEMKSNGFATGEVALSSVDENAAKKMLAELTVIREEIKRTKENFDQLKEELKNYRARDIGREKGRNEKLSETDAKKFVGIINKLLLKINTPRGETSRLGVEAGKIFSEVSRNLLRSTMEKGKNDNKMNEKKAA